MEEKIVKEEDLRVFEQYLVKKEACRQTVEKYLHCVRCLADWLSGRALTKELAIEWKESLRNRGLAAATVNCYIAAANSFFACVGGGNK